MISYIVNQIQSSVNVKNSILENNQILSEIELVSKKIIKTYRNKGKVIVAGNGGSAADAQHFVAELVGRFYMERPAFPAIALTTNSSIVTAIGNDYGYEKIFSRQIEAIANVNDIFIAISTSGNSSNIIDALKLCKNKGIFTVGLTGESGGIMKRYTSICLQVPSFDTPRIQEGHIMIYHIISAIVEKELTKNK